MAQLIKYESTGIEPAKSAGQIMDLVRRYGGRSFTQIWGEGQTVLGIRFTLAFEELGPLPVQMHARTARIEEILNEGGKWKSQGYAKRKELIAAQAQRIAWRHLKDLTEQLLLAVALGLKTPGEAFMDGVEVEDPATGETTTMGKLLAQHAQISSSGQIRLLGRC